MNITEKIQHLKDVSAKIEEAHKIIGLCSVSPGESHLSRIEDLTAICVALKKTPTTLLNDNSMHIRFTDDSGYKFIFVAIASA